jgi:predicted RNase H-like HicB family nuclease
MQYTYPIVLTPYKNGYVVYMPDFDCNTEGRTLEKALYMARDAIGQLGLSLIEDGKPLPEPSLFGNVTQRLDDITAFVYIDFDVYRQEEEQRERLKRIEHQIRSANRRKLAYTETTRRVSARAS